MRSSKKRTLKKVLTNIFVVLLVLVYFGSSVASEFTGQINSFLGISTSKGWKSC